MVDAVALAEPAADRHRVLAHLPRDPAVERHAVERALDEAEVLLPMRERAHELLRTAAQGHGRIVRMEGQAYVRLLRLGHHRLQESLRPLELLGARMRAHAVLRGQVFRERVVVRRVARTRAPRLFFIALGQPVRVEVVFDDGQAHLSGGADGGDHVRDLRVGSRPPPDDVVEPRDHHVVEGQAAGLERLDAGPEVGLRPGDLRPAGEDVVDADLLHPPHPRLVRRAVEAKADLRCARPFGGHAREGRRALDQRERQRGRDRRCADALEDVSAAPRAHRSLPRLPTCEKGGTSALRRSGLFPKASRGLVS